MSAPSSVMVGLADIQVLKPMGRLTCLGLGSGVSICALDPIANVGAMAHVMLPYSSADKENVKPGKYADTAVQELLERMEREGADRTRTVFALAGGATIFQGGNGKKSIDFGARNGDALTEQIRKHELRTVAEDLGGNLGRTAHMTIDTGEVVVRTVAGGERVLCNLTG